MPRAPFSAVRVALPALPQDRPATTILHPWQRQTAIFGGAGEIRSTERGVTLHTFADGECVDLPVPEPSEPTRMTGHDYADYYCMQVRAVGFAAAAVHGEGGPFSNGAGPLGNRLHFGLAALSCMAAWLHDGLAAWRLDCMAAA